MMTCVIFASLRDVLPTARSSTSAVMDVKMVGHGREPILRAVYTEDAVMMTQPMQPIRMPAADSCPRRPARSLAELMLFSFVYPLPLKPGSRVTARTR